MTEEQTLTQEPVAAITSPWRDGTVEGEVSADLFALVEKRVIHDSPMSTQVIKAGSPGAYIGSVVDPSRMQIGHYEYLFAVLDDVEVLVLIDQLAARVRLVAERVRVAA